MASNDRLIVPIWHLHSGARRAWLWAVAATLLVSAPCLFVGFAYDDLGQRLILEERVPGYPNGWLGLYDFTPPVLPAKALMERGVLPWFSDPGLSLRFLRPLSSASLALDAALFGRAALLAHVHSLLWMAVLSGVAAHLYQRWFEPPVASVCALIFALSGVHAISTAWLAARHTLVAATFGALSLAAWLRFREDGARFGRTLAGLALVASLLSSESGLVTVVLLVSYELGTRGLRRGLSGAALPLTLGVAYLGAYAALGYGVRNSGFYVSPFETPLAYARAALWGVPALAAELLLGLPSIASTLGGPPTRLSFALIGVAACAAALGLFAALRERLRGDAGCTLRWLALGSLISLFALVGAPVSGRVLLLPMLGGAALLGNALLATRAAARVRRRWWIACVPIALLQFGLSPLLRLTLPFQFMHSAESQRQLAERADVGACARRGSVYLLNGSDPSLAMYAASALAFYTPEKAGADVLRVLSMAPERQLLTRIAPRVFELEVLGGPRWANPFEHLFRPADRPLEPAQRIELPELGVQVESVSQGLYTRVRFEFRQDPASLPACLIVWRHGRIEPLAMPAVGESAQIEHEPGPLGM